MIPPRVPKKVEEKKPVDDKVAVSEPKAVADSEENDIVSGEKEDELKESVEEYEKGEKLDLEVSDPEYDDHEYKEIEKDDEGDVGPTEAVDDEEQEHQDVFKERQKRKDLEVFVGGLDKDATTEDNLRNVFSKVGEVTEIRLVRNPQTKKNKGFAFIRFATVEQAKRACAELKHAVVCGKQCNVTPSEDSDTLILGNICKTLTKEALNDKLKHYGVDTIADLRLPEDKYSAGMNRGFAFLEFYSRSDASNAYSLLQKRDVTFGDDMPAMVRFHNSFIDTSDEIMSQVKEVFVDDLHSSWDKDKVRSLLEKYGRIDSIMLARDMPKTGRKNYGFITFNIHDAAVTCAKSIHNVELGDGDNKARVRARLSFPRLGQITRGGVQGRRPVIGKPVAPPSRSYDRRPPGGFKRDYNRHEEVPPPRSRATSDYGSRVYSERQRRASYRGSGYADLPRPRTRTPTSRSYVDERARDYVSLSGSKRSYSAAMDDVHQRSAELGFRHSRARLDYDLGSRASQYGDAYSDRVRRSNMGYSSHQGMSRSGGSYGGTYSSSFGSYYMSRGGDDGVHPQYAEAGIHHSHTRSDYAVGRSASQYGDASSDRVGISNMGYSSRQGMSHSGGSYGDTDVGGMYSSSFHSDYMSRGDDVGGSSNSLQYHSRGSGGSRYKRGSGS